MRVIHHTSTHQRARDRPYRHPLIFPSPFFEKGAKIKKNDSAVWRLGGPFVPVCVCVCVCVFMCVWGGRPS